MRCVFREMGVRQHFIPTLRGVQLPVHVGSISLPQARKARPELPVLEMAAPWLQFEEVLSYIQSCFYLIYFCPR